MEILNNRIVWLYSPVQKFMVLRAEAKVPLETGGILMGYFGQPGNVPVVLFATGPGPQAFHLQNYYRPDSKFDESQITTIYEKFGKRITYLGDWHTHLAPFTALSYRDKRTLCRIAKCKSARIDTPLMLILSHDDQWEATIWQGMLHKSYIWPNRLSTAKLTVHLFSNNCLDPFLNQIS